MITIAHSLSVGNTGAFALISEGFNESLQDGLTPDNDAMPPYDRRSRVVFANIEGEPVGVIVYRLEPGRLRLQLAYVEPSSRGRGVFKRLRVVLAERAERDNLELLDLRPRDWRKAA